jgi:hypothetical protein
MIAGIFRVAPMLAFTLSATPLRAEEPSGCDKFKWPIGLQQAALATPAKIPVSDGGAVDLGVGARAHLEPVDQVRFPLPPERAPASGSYGAVLTLPAPPAGTYTVSLSAAAWVDVIQNGERIKPAGFSGARDCPNIRKTLKFKLQPTKTTLQLSNVAAPEIAIVVLGE